MTITPEERERLRCERGIAICSDSSHHASRITIIDTKEGIEAFAMLQVIGALSLEVNTGMKFSRGSVMNLARDRYGCVKRTKAGVLAEMRAKYTEATGLECKVGLR
jgi:hypothetical protein